MGARIVDMAANHARRIEEAIARHGQTHVEMVLDAALSLEQHIDVKQALSRARYSESENDAEDPLSSTFVRRFDTLPGAGDSDDGDGDDSISGDDGDDILQGGAGEDQIYGGVGNDTVLYWSSASFVTIDLRYGTGTTGDATGDMLSGIEIVQGSAHDDVITGGGENNNLQGMDS